MKIVFGVIGVFICTISPILTLFVNDNNPKSGYLSAQNVRGISRTGVRVMQRRHFSGNSLKNTDSIVDSHFKVMKTDPYIHVYNLRNEKRRDTKDVPASWTTEAPNKETRNVHMEDFGLQPGSLSNGQNGKLIEKNINSQRLNVKQQRAKSIREQSIWAQGPPRNYVRDTKLNLINVNIHKKPISADYQKAIRINSYRQMAPLSAYRPEEKNKKKATTLVMGKNIQGTPAQSDHSFNMTTQKDDDVDRYTVNENVKAEYKKRDIDNKHEASHTKRNMISDNMRKYIVSKDKKINVERKSNKKYSRIGIQEDSIQAEDSPYAIFYRMHPETLDEQEVFVPMGSIEEHAGVFSSSKSKRLSNDLPNELIDVTGTVPKSNAKKVKFHKKVKNFANYRFIPSHEHSG